MNTGPGRTSRNQLLAIIRERRGLHKSELMRLADKGWGNVGHHLAKLEEHGFIETESRGRFLWVFDRDVPAKERDILVAMRPGAARRILEHLGLRQRATVRTLSEELAVSKKVIRLHLNSLHRAEAVEKLPGHPPEFATATNPTSKAR